MIILRWQAGVFPASSAWGKLGLTAAAIVHERAKRAEEQLAPQYQASRDPALVPVRC